ncbi:putative membrane protein YuiB [Paenibacillus sp. J31TS4]|uniref:YuiB family protein n=1 Tax=Paenibacillus sp. J31TS4 TaxID=2807195 RepID=UPI001AFDE1A6|nr:YuiB family protein [Paenibacillus sp. J31TS4]GIP40717.1 putative membrane protein YuiB [Paenibacillus sp. J31TS4]
MSALIIELLQWFVLTLLSFVMFFGLGFIINMLMKTTWFPIYAYFIFVAGLIWWTWGSESLVENIKSYTLADYIPLIGGMAGAIVSGYTIKTLRLKGFKMF